MVTCKSCERPILADHAYKITAKGMAEHIRCDEPDLHAPRVERPGPELVFSRG